MKKAVLICLLSSISAPCNFTMPVYAQTLTSEAIAENAYKVAQQMNRTGRCYEGVCRAMRPLGVELWGEAAFEADGLLSKDSRFVPLIVTDTAQLRRGDIIVYRKSPQHPYGHISVYEGNLVEASDHISPVTHTKNYGGATVFRLNQEFQNQNLANSEYQPYAQSSLQNGGFRPLANTQQIQQNMLPPEAPDFRDKKGFTSKTTFPSSKVIKGMERHLFKRLIRYILQ